MTDFSEPCYTTKFEGRKEKKMAEKLVSVRWERKRWKKRKKTDIFDIELIVKNGTGNRPCCATVDQQSTKPRNIV